jgi:predicted double-glycine peptidase
LAGVRALSGKSRTALPGTEDPAEAIMQDDAALRAVQHLPVELQPLLRRRKRSLPPPMLAPILKEGSDNGLLEMQQDKEKDTAQEARHEDDAAEEEVRVRAEEQKEDFDCGPAALKGIFNHYGITDESLNELTRDVGADPEGGTAPQRLADAAKQHGLNVAAKDGMTLDELRKHLDEGHPVIVPIQVDAADADTGGHYVIVKGVGDNEISYADPSNPDTDGHYSIDDFMSRWHDKDKNGKEYKNFGIAVWSNDSPVDTTTKAANIFHRTREKVEDAYGALENRYGPTMAKVILGSGAVGLPLPVPGSELLTAAPALAAGELVHAYNGNYDDSAIKKKKQRKAFLEKFKTMVLPASAGGAAGLALHKPTDTLVPAQTTKFPGDTQPHLIRGGIYPGASASVLEDTGGGYMYVGPESGR